METDIELMMRAKTGDDDAFSELVRRHYKGVVNYIYKFTNGKESSEDLAQEVFLRVYRAAERYEPKAKFTTWLYKIASNLCITTLKRGDDSYSLDEIEENTGRLENPNSQSADDAVYRKELKNAIFHAMESLPENERVAIILAKYQGFEYKEIAEVLDCSVGAVKAYVYRGRTKLIEELKPYLKKGEAYEV